MLFWSFGLEQVTPNNSTVIHKSTGQVICNRNSAKFQVNFEYIINFGKFKRTRYINIGQYPQLLLTKSRRLGYKRIEIILDFLIPTDLKQSSISRIESDICAPSNIPTLSSPI